MPHWHVLVVEDDLTYRTALAKYFKGRFKVTLASTVRQAIEYLKHQDYDLGFIDLKLPDGSGFDFMKYARKAMPDMMMIVMTGFGTVETAVKAVQRGAFHYLMKPFPMERLDQLVTEALKQKEHQKKSGLRNLSLSKKFQFDDIIGNSPAMMEVFDLVEKVSTSDSTILIRGESGTGKELIARAIHQNSNRAQEAFITVNCGALQEELLESELFGHVRGAFTGAVSSRQGRFELAHRGTIFLDEVGDMSPRLQVKLLRVLQERQFEPVGSSETRTVDVRIIAATHQDLEKAVTEKRIREDLYYRLNVIPVFTPPLRDRSEDIPRLIDHFLERFNQENSKNVTGMTEECLSALSRCAWPGNVRELENLMERLVILKSEGQITSRDLPDKYFEGKACDTLSKPILPEEGMDLNEMISGMEEVLIRQALQRTGGNRNKAARLLGLKRTTLVEKLKRKKITRSVK